MYIYVYQHLLMTTCRPSSVLILIFGCHRHGTNDIRTKLTLFSKLRRYLKTFLTKGIQEPEDRAAFPSEVAAADSPNLHLNPRDISSLTLSTKYQILLVSLLLHIFFAHTTDNLVKLTKNINIMRKTVQFCLYIKRILVSVWGYICPINSFKYLGIAAHFHSVKTPFLVYI